MVISAKKFDKLRKKLEKKIIGEYGSDKGLGCDLEVKHYSYSVNDYGDVGSLVYIDSQYVKGIVVNSIDNNETQVLDLNVRDGEVRLYVPVSTVVDDISDDHYEFCFDDMMVILKK